MNMDRVYIEPLYLLKPTKNAYKSQLAQGLYSALYGIGINRKNEAHKIYRFDTYCQEAHFDVITEANVSTIGLMGAEV